jgi:para-aminobenzoate synthetase component I
MSRTAQETSFGPVEAARSMRRRHGFSFLDSSLTSRGAFSLLACEPDLVLQGRDWVRLEAELEARSRTLPDTGWPDGAAIGWVDFDGSFRFSFHDRVHVFLHDDERWILPPVLEEATPCGGGSWKGPVFRPVVGRERFLESVRRAKEYIAAGDIYQVCLSHPFEACGWQGDPWEFHERLRHFSPAPHAAYLDGGGRVTVSASPESFLSMSGRRITTRPIKGTRPRLADPQGDQLSSYELMTSAKEIAELIMITDLERNDLGKVCSFGSVGVPRLLELETYEQVFHLVSTVEGELRPGVGHVRALRECFPGGSISGAPKKRALEIIDELEPLPRGGYTGAIGFFGFNGESRFSIAIRTVYFEQGVARFHSGAGIVADSEPEREWEETLHKAAGIIMAAERDLRV